MQEALKKAAQAAQAAQAEPPRKKRFTFRYWITTKDANAEGNEFIKYATSVPIELEDTDTTFNPIEWWIGKAPSLPFLPSTDTPSIPYPHSPSFWFWIAVITTGREFEPPI